MYPVEQWFYYFRNMKSFTTLAGGPKLLDERYRGLLDASKTRRFTDEEWDKYIDAMFTQRELDNYAGPVYRRGLEEGVKQGIAKGIEQGLEQGLKQGLEQGTARRNIEIARAMRAKGYDIKSIVELTGINPDEKA